MTPLQDAEYTKEVTQCLSQSMVRLLQTRPEDPIQYLAQCLRNYRRNHPKCQACKGEGPSIADNTSDSLPKPLGKVENERPQIEKLNTKTKVKTISGSEIKSSSATQANHAIRTGWDEDEDKEMSRIRNQYGHIEFVHKEFRRAMLSLEDLFDNDDFG